MRVGIGYDVHSLTEGRKLILGGVHIPYPKGLLGHSDGDVLLHAICDALLGAAGLSDIGCHFPDNDPKYKGISSLLLLKEVRRIIKEKGFGIVNIDSTIVAQKPKLAPFLRKMEKNIAGVLEIESDSVNVKATTTEGLGFTGEGKGMAVYAVASLGKVDSR